ncbi:DUF262 domain-containing protein [Erysipelothrix rhusiopathiae]|nr:DUF262 domain-containing protein [Erysipelothrix rhusiopathiae]
MASKYEVTTETLNGLENLEIPQFQRGYVWNLKKKEELISTLHSGYPFGSLLTFKGDKGKEQLLDGQQRLSTIRDYMKNPESYWRNLNKHKFEESLNLINSKISSGEYVKEEDFANVISKRVDMADWVDDLIENREVKENIVAKDFRNIIKNIQKEIDDYLDINSIKIPIIRFTGERENIAQVFENLNKGGVQLTKFEIFAAAWNHHTFKLEKTTFQNEILNEVKKYYVEKSENAEELGFTLEGFSEDELSENRCINLFEFGMALGRFASIRVDSLLPAKSDKSRNELGFGLLGIFTNTDPKKLGEIVDKADEIYNNIELILYKTDKISKNLESIFSKILTQQTSHKNNNLGYQRYLNTSAKTLSYFAALWNLEDSKNTIKNLPIYYIKDSIENVWTSHGDQRLFEYYPDPDKNHRTYEEKVDKSALMSSFKLWIDDKNKGRINFSGEVKAFETIRANLTYLASELPIGEPLQFEHIFAKGKLGFDDNAKKNINIGSLGNIMFLPKTLNESKKIKTLYELDNYEDYITVIKKSRYPAESNFGKVWKFLEEKKYKEINDYLSSRAYESAEQIIDALYDSVFK